MLIALESQRDWVYVLHRKLLPGYNCIAETVLTVCFGRPDPYERFTGYRLMGMYSVKYDGTLLSNNNAAGRCFNVAEAVEYCVEQLLHKLNVEYPSNFFYSRFRLYGCAGVVFKTHERQYEWDIKPVLDERLRKRYADSINRTAASAVVR